MIAGGMYNRAGRRCKFSACRNSIVQQPTDEGKLTNFPEDSPSGRGCSRIVILITVMAAEEYE